jgi:predicted amidohydrolase YtcJ
MQRLAIFFLLLLLAAAQHRVTIHAGRLLDVRTGGYRNDVYILVQDDKIVAIESSAPAGVNVIDLSKQTVLPGLYDCHAHVLGDPKDWSSTAGTTSNPQTVFQHRGRRAGHKKSPGWIVSRSFIRKGRMGATQSTERVLAVSCSPRNASWNTSGFPNDSDVDVGGQVRVSTSFG